MSDLLLMFLCGLVVFGVGWMSGSAAEIRRAENSLRKAVELITDYHAVLEQVENDTEMLRQALAFYDCGGDCEDCVGDMGQFCGKLAHRTLQ